MIELNCPQCGSLIKLNESTTKLISCHHCSSTLLIESSGLVQHSIQSNMKIGVTFSWKEQSYHPQGYFLVKHGNGYRKEWWVLDDLKNSFWLIEEDEDLFLLKDNNESNYSIPPWMTLQVNTQLNLDNKSWLVTQKGTYQYQGFQGTVPVNQADDKPIYYTYLISKNAQTLMFLFRQDQIQVRSGYWLDPFEISINQL